MQKKLPAITVVVIFLACLLLYFPVALIFGALEPFWSGRAGAGFGMSLLDAGVCLALCSFIVLTLLVWPMAFAGFLDREHSWTRIPQVVLLWALPSVGFGYFIGEFRGWIQAYDYAVAIVLPVIAAVVFMRRTGRWIETAILLSLSFFLGLFLIGDILGPFPTFVRFASSSTVVYTLRTVLAILGLAAVLFLPVREAEVENEITEAKKTQPAHWMFGLAGLGFALIAIRQIVSMQTSWYASDLTPVTILFTGWVFFRRNHFSKRTQLIVAAAQVTALLVPITRAFTASGADLWTQSLVGYQTLVLAAFVALFTHGILGGGEGGRSRN